MLLVLACSSSGLSLVSFLGYKEMSADGRVAFVGALSNVSTLSQTYPWMAWIQGDSAAKHLLQGVISGILPPVLLAVLMLVLPIILRRESSRLAVTNGLICQKSSSSKACPVIPRSKGA